MTSSLRTRISLSHAALLSAVLLALAVAFYGALARSLYRDVDQKLLALARVVAESSVRNLLRPGYNDFARLLEEFFGVPAAGRFIQVLDPSGRVGPRSRNLLLRRLPVPRPLLHKALHGEMVFHTFSGGRGDLRVLFYPVVVRGRVRNVVQVATPLDEVQATLRTTLFALTLGVPCALLVALWAGWWLTGRALRPLERVIDALRRLDTDKLDTRIPEDDRAEEVQALARTVNGLIDRLARTVRRVREFMADASHELRTPLTVLRGEAEVALRHSRSPEEYQAVLASALEEIHRMSRIVEDLLLLAKGDLGQVPVNKQALELNAFLGEIAAQAGVLAEAKGVELTWAGGPRVVIDADPLRLRQLFWNLLDNAVKYTPEGGKVFLSHTRCAADRVRITVKDTGIGIPPEHLDRIFERFYRVDKHRSRAQGGSGLGLSICRWVARVHGGRIYARSEPGRGSSFIVELPCRAGGEQPDTQGAASHRSTPPSGAGSVPNTEPHISGVSMHR